jgi:chromosome segregation protein
MADLGAAEETAASIAAELTDRAAIEGRHLAVHEAARARVTELRLREARLAAELESTERDRSRIASERAAAEASASQHRRDLAISVPPRDLDLDAAVAEADRLLADANQEIASLRAASRAKGEEAAAVRRAESARQAEAESARRRLAEAVRRLDAERAVARAGDERRAEVEGRLESVRTELAAAGEALDRATLAREAARAASADADARRRAAEERASGLASGLAARRAHLATLEARLREEDERGIAKAARRRGGRRVDEELVVDPALRRAVEAALDELARAYVVDAAVVAALAAERGIVVVRERATGPEGRGATYSRRFEQRLADAGGQLLADAIRRDPSDSVRAVLARTVVADDLAAALGLQADLPPGWSIVTRDGAAVVTEVAVRLGAGDTPLERRAEIERLRADASELDAQASKAQRAAEEAATAADDARRALDDATAVETRAATERRRAEEGERTTGRDVEAALREAAWHAAQVARLEADVERAREASAASESAGLWTDDGAIEAAPGEPDRDAVAAWGRRVADLRERRDRLAGQQASGDAERRDAEARRARAEATVAMDEARVAAADRELAALAERAERAADERRTLATDLALAADEERAAATALNEVRAAAAADRDRLGSAERDATAARDRLRTADERLRAADRADLEARLGRDALREQVLVELAGLGELGRRRLEAEAGIVSIAVAPPLSQGIDVRADEAALAGADGTRADEPDDGAALEIALDVVAERWASESPPAEAPSPGRLATLRRRYHELGAANPFAVEEYDALRERLDGLETQQRDLHTAIDRTRELIGELNAMIADQFRRTFAALETAFDARFQQLFGGGFARLSLTDPDDLSSTGVEIVARPPGKKAQALAMLSGGERALTAVALLFAMLEVRPVPFCVLDEVDAALDEANVGRFSEALRSLADRTQFIVITHNRGTIEVADALYGVTVGDDSVSRVISLRLDEAQAIADRQGAGPTGSEANRLVEVG